MSKKHPSIKEMGGFVECMEKLEKTHEWCEKKKDFVKRGKGRPKKPPTVVLRVPAAMVTQIKKFILESQK